MKVIKVTGAIIQEKNRFLICRRGPDEKAGLVMGISWWEIRN